ncbi:hypothetical protein MRX96_027728 [Rhipicephalus microplus]
MMTAMLLVGCVLVFLAASGAQESPDDVVQTINGPLRGVDVPTTTSSVRAYLGVPFGEPPVGDLRFKKPVPKKPWKGVYNATSQPPLCPQMPVRINNFFLVEDSDPVSEDCLYLNVFVPYKEEL